MLSNQMFIYFPQHAMMMFCSLVIIASHIEIDKEFFLTIK